MLLIPQSKLDVLMKVFLNIMIGRTQKLVLEPISILLQLMISVRDHYMYYNFLQQYDFFEFVILLSWLVIRARCLVLLFHALN